MCCTVRCSVCCTVCWRIRFSVCLGVFFLNVSRSTSYFFKNKIFSLQINLSSIYRAIVHVCCSVRCTATYAVWCTVYWSMRWSLCLSVFSAQLRDRSKRECFHTQLCSSRKCTIREGTCSDTVCMLWGWNALRERSRNVPRYGLYVLYSHLCIIEILLTYTPHLEMSTYALSEILCEHICSSWEIEKRPQIWRICTIHALMCYVYILCYIYACDIYLYVYLCLIYILMTYTFVLYIYLCKIYIRMTYTDVLYIYLWHTLLYYIYTYEIILCIIYILMTYTYVLYVYVCLCIIYIIRTYTYILYIYLWHILMYYIYTYDIHLCIIYILMTYTDVLHI